MSVMANRKSDGPLRPPEMGVGRSMIRGLGTEKVGPEWRLSGLRQAEA